MGDLGFGLRGFGTGLGLAGAFEPLAEEEELAGARFGDGGGGMLTGDLGNGGICFDLLPLEPGACIHS